MYDNDVPAYVTCGPVIRREGYEAGAEGFVGLDDSPYPANLWSGELWLEGYIDGAMDRNSLKEPDLSSTMNNS